MEGEANNEFQDWEVLHNSDTSQVDSAGSDRSPRNFEGIEGDSEGMIRSDYFSLENKERYARTVSEGGDSVDSDNPSWIDPGSETQYAGRNSGEFWSDSGSDRSEERKFGDFDGKQELGLAEIGKSQVDFEGIEEMKGGSKSLGKFVAGEGEFSGLDGKRELGSAENEKIQVDFVGIEEMKGGGENLGKFVAGENKISDFDVKYELGSLGNEKIQVGFEEFGEIQTRDKDLGKGGDALVSMKFGGVKEESEMDINDYAKQREGSEVVGDVDGGNENAVIEKGNENVEVELAKSDAESALGEGEKRRVVWWKVPIELLKFCVFRVSPIWSFSMAAAVMGFLIIGRRLYKMKRKSQSLQLKVTVDDKKVSQFMSRAARLNEAFSVVRRVPIIRPSLPGAGLTPWPVMSMR